MFEDNEDNEDDEVLFFYKEDESTKYSEAQLRDLSIGERFVFYDRVFTKVDDRGFHIAICNVRNDRGEISYIHPNRKVSRIQ